MQNRDGATKGMIGSTLYWPAGSPKHLPSRNKLIFLHPLAAWLGKPIEGINWPKSSNFTSWQAKSVEFCCLDSRQIPKSSRDSITHWYQIPHTLLKFINFHPPFFALVLPNYPPCHLLHNLNSPLSTGKSLYQYVHLCGFGIPKKATVEFVSLQVVGVGCHVFVQRIGVSADSGVCRIYERYFVVSIALGVLYL